jgi:ABC-type polysaccharide/polyol phosphate transport system ATPase subunit
MATAIEFNHVSKQYRLGLVSTRTLSNDLKRWWVTSIMGKEDPFLKIGSTNDRSKKADSEYVWALKDIDFKVERGDVVGIIGKNGAGKSTLLKLLSKVTGPTTGTIKASDRIGSLLEVGTGFHPEMTGRENIYLNGAILGMTKTEISRKLDEIIDFSGCERYIDTPVKRYSSGMTVRLGFAVAAFLEPEILVVDEVLAVGDAEFQKKAIGKMKDVSSGEGRTVLFVSHNMASIRQLCRSGILLENGLVTYTGTATDTVAHYLSGFGDTMCYHADITMEHREFANTTREIELLTVSMTNDGDDYATNQPLDFYVRMYKHKNNIESATLEIMFNNSSCDRLGSYISGPIDLKDVQGEFTVHVRIVDHHLAKGTYSVCFQIGQKDIHSGLKDYDIVHNVLFFSVAYSDQIKKDTIVLWRKNWGSTVFQGDCEVISDRRNRNLV